MPITIGVVPSGVNATQMADYFKRLLEDHTKGYEPVDLVDSSRLPTGNEYANTDTVYFLVLHSGHDVDANAQQSIGNAMTAAFPDWGVLVVWLQVGPFFANGGQLL